MCAKSISVFFFLSFFASWTETLESGRSVLTPHRTTTSVF